MTSSEAVIYLSAARACVQDDNYRSYQTLRQPFRDLIAVNDETLAAGTSVTHKAPVVIIPLVGDVVTDQRISPGQIQVITNPTITNPYKEELVNYLIIGLEGNPGVVDFELTNNNVQRPIPGIHLGKFDGRKDGVHKLAEAYGIFVFVIEGAFEIQNRLLHARDGLALWNLTEVEFEALSNEAILMFIEVS
jgi:hypothetical protein